MDNITQMFESFIHIDSFDIECLELLERIMNIDNPMRFDDAFATEEQLTKLEDELDRFDSNIPQTLFFKQIIVKLEPCTTDSVLFI